MSVEMIQEKKKNQILNNNINNKINNVQNADNYMNLIRYQNAAINEFK